MIELLFLSHCVNDVCFDAIIQSLSGVIFSSVDVCKEFYSSKNISKREAVVKSGSQSADEYVCEMMPTVGMFTFILSLLFQ